MDDAEFRDFLATRGLHDPLDLARDDVMAHEPWPEEWPPNA